MARLKWVNSSAKGDVKFTALNYIDGSGSIKGGVFADHKTNKVSWHVGDAKGTGRNVRQAQGVVEKTVAK